MTVRPEDNPINRLVNKLDAAGHTGAGVALAAGEVVLLNTLCMEHLLEGERGLHKWLELLDDAKGRDKLEQEERDGKD